MSNDAKADGQQPTNSGKKKRAGQGKGYTEPKGRPTVHTVPGATSRRLSSTVEWIIAIAVLLVIVAAIFYFGRNFRSETGFTLELPTAPGALAAVVAAGVLPS